MIFSTKSVNRIIVFLIYSGIIAMTVWAGSRIMNSSLDSKFYRDYLIKWDVAIRAINSKRFIWPKLTRRNHNEYMTHIVDFMRDNSIEVPKSNTNYPWIYRMKKIWADSEDIFVVCFYNKIVLYGVPEKTLNKVDAYADGANDLRIGWFTGKKNKNNDNYTGQLKL